MHLYELIFLLLMLLFLILSFSLNGLIGELFNIFIFSLLILDWYVKLLELYLLILGELFNIFIFSLLILDWYVKLLELYLLILYFWL